MKDLLKTHFALAQKYFILGGGAHTNIIDHHTKLYTLVYYIVLDIQGRF